MKLEVELTSSEWDTILEVLDNECSFCDEDMSCQECPVFKVKLEICKKPLDKLNNL